MRRERSIEEEVIDERYRLWRKIHETVEDDVGITKIVYTHFVGDGESILACVTYSYYHDYGDGFVKRYYGVACSLKDRVVAMHRGNNNDFRKSTIYVNNKCTVTVADYIRDIAEKIYRYVKLDFDEEARAAVMWIAKLAEMCDRAARYQHIFSTSTL